MNDGPTRVCVVDDHVAICVGSLELLTARAGDLVAGPFAATVRALLAADAHPPGVVLLDTELRDGSDPGANVARLRRAGYAVVIYTDETRPAMLRPLLTAGAAAVVSKNDDAAALEDAVRAAACGKRTHHLSPVTATAFTDLGRETPRLTPREVEVLRRFVAGAMVKEIATALGVKISTIKTHLKKIKKRYAAVGVHASTRSDLLAAAQQDGLVPLAPPPPVSGWRAE